MPEPAGTDSQVNTKSALKRGGSCMSKKKVSLDREFIHPDVEEEQEKLPPLVEAADSYNRKSKTCFESDTSEAEAARTPRGVTDRSRTTSPAQPAQRTPSTHF